MNHLIDVLTIELSRCQKKLTKIEQDIKYCPAIELLELHKELAEKLDSNVDRFSSEFESWVKSAAAKEKKLKREMKTSSAKRDKLWEQRAFYESRMSQVSSALSLQQIREQA